MLEFQEKQKIRSFLYSRPVLIVLAVILAVILNAAYGMYQKYRNTGENLAIAEREEASLKAKEQELQAQLDRLQTPRGVEEEIRKKFRVVKERESVIIVVGEGENTANATEASAGFESLMDKIKNWLR